MTDYYNGAPLPSHLSDDEILECFQLYAVGDLKAYKKLIEHNLRLVIKIAMKFSDNKVDMNDLISAGNWGLIKAIKTYDIDRNVKFSTYAGRCIENQILLYLRYIRRAGRTISLDDSIFIEGNEENIELNDTIICPHNNVEEDYENKETYKEICEALSLLSPLERHIIIRTEGIGCEQTSHKVVANECGYHRSYVSRIAKHARQKMADYILEKYPSTYVKRYHRS